jgi:sulfite exporter TauE/SafE
METSLTSVGVFALLGLGIVFGLKHATEVDHVVAVSTIVSEHRSVFRSALVGGLWGVGHTASLLVVGVVVLVFRVLSPFFLFRAFVILSEKNPSLRGFYEGSPSTSRNYLPPTWYEEQGRH